MGLRPSSRLTSSPLVSFPSCSPPSSLVPCFSSTALFFHFQSHSHPRPAPSAFHLPPAIAHILDSGDTRPLWRFNDLLLKEAPPQGGPLLACSASVGRFHAGQLALCVASTVRLRRQPLQPRRLDSLPKEAPPRRPGWWPSPKCMLRLGRPLLCGPPHHSLVAPSPPAAEEARHAPKEAGDADADAAAAASPPYLLPDPLDAHHHSLIHLPPQR
jgi:hypothetical protein